MSHVVLLISVLVAVIGLAAGAVLVAHLRRPVELLAPVLMLEIPAAPMPVCWSRRAPITADAITDEAWVQFVAERGPWELSPETTLSALASNGLNAL